jgi:plastocyanin
MTTRNSAHHTRRLRLAFAMVAMIGMSACSDHSSPANSAASTTSTTSGYHITINMPKPDVGAVVVIKDDAFNPSVVTIKAGQSVEWRFDDNDWHSIKGLPGTQDKDMKVKSGTYTSSFANRGTYPYHDGIHPEMTGTVQVE